MLTSTFSWSHSTLEHCILYMYTVGVAGLGFSGIAGMQTCEWKTSGVGSQPPNRSWHKQWARRAPHCERLFMSSRVNYTQRPNIRHHVSTRDPKEDLQEQSQAFMKASTVFHWPAFQCRGTKAT